MSIQIHPINPNIGAIITNIDLNYADESALKVIQTALLKYQVIFFRQQNLAAQAQVQLAQSFGTLHIHPIYPCVENAPEIIVLDSHRLNLQDNELWHTDVTFSHTPPLGCVLQAIKVPPSGGDTLWASATAAFKALPKVLQSSLRQLSATHDIRKSFPLEHFASNAKERAKLEASFKNNPPVSHPVIRIHPVTGEEVLFINEGFTTHINELSTLESKALLNYLFKHAVKPEFHLRWQWHNGDVAIWDNRCTQHKALFDYGDAHRIMHRATINGCKPYASAIA